MAAIDLAYSIDRIEPYLSVGSWQAATDEENLEDLRFNAILSIEIYNKPQNVLKLYEKYKIHSYEIHVDNLPSENIQRWFPRIYTIINHYINKKNSVLINCGDGNGRALIAAAAYIMIRAYLTNKPKTTIADNVIKFVCRQRQNANPLPQMIASLKDFERQIRDGKYDIDKLK